MSSRMNPLPRTIFATRCSWLRSHPYTVLGSGVLVLFAVAFLRQRDSEWSSVYVRAAYQLKNGQNLYEHGHGYLYPPFQAWLALPLASLSPMLGLCVWLSINLICLSLALRWAWRLAGGGQLEPVGAAPRREHLV